MEVWYGKRDNYGVQETVIIVAEDEKSAYKQLTDRNQNNGLAPPAQKALRKLYMEKEGIRILRCPVPPGK